MRRPLVGAFFFLFPRAFDLSVSRAVAPGSTGRRVACSGWNQFRQRRVSSRNDAAISARLGASSRSTLGAGALIPHVEGGCLSSPPRLSSTASAWPQPFSAFGFTMTAGTIGGLSWNDVKPAFTVFGAMPSTQHRPGRSFADVRSADTRTPGCIFDRADSPHVSRRSLSISISPRPLALLRPARAINEWGRSRQWICA